MNDRGGVNAVSFMRPVVKKFNGAGISVLRVLDAQERPGGRGKFFTDYERRGLRCGGERCVLGVGDEGELAGLGRVDGADGGDVGFRVGRVERGAGGWGGGRAGGWTYSQKQTNNS